MKKVLIPRSARLIPSRESLRFHRERNATYTFDKFETYNDWFYFIHIDPFLRWIHAVGMMIGIFFYSISLLGFWVYGWSTAPILHFFAGAFFFYFLPVISHYIYDGGTAKSTPDKYHSTFLPVVHINLMTLTGTYDRWLRKFVEKYPFTREAWELEEREVRKQ